MEFLGRLKFLSFVILAGIIFGLVQVFVTNPIAQRIFPTLETDGFGRRYLYRIVHAIVLVLSGGSALFILDLLGF